MATPGGSILPQAYFDGVSSLWGACAYLGSAIVAAGLVFQSVRTRPDPTSFIWLFAKVLMIGIATLFIREWLMRMNDVITAFSGLMGVDPTTVDDRFVGFISGKTPANPDTSIWDVIWDTKSIGTAICYALLWFFGWIAWGLQYIVKLIGDILLTAGWALSPIFLAFFMLRPMAAVGLKYVMGLVAIVCWPFGWVMAAVVTNAMLDAAATASLIPIMVPGGGPVAPALTVLLIGLWMLITSVLAPYVTYRVLTSGANPAAAFAQGIGGIGQAAVSGAVGAATVAVTGGAAAPAVVTAAALGAMAAGAESTARGGGSARTTSSVLGGAAAFYGGRFVREQTGALKDLAAAETRRAKASEDFAAQFNDSARHSRERKTSFPQQPHHPDPNKAAIEIEARHVQE
jgi:type IV secretion system protein TrbL